MFNLLGILRKPKQVMLLIFSGLILAGGNQFAGCVVHDMRESAQSEAKVKAALNEAARVPGAKILSVEVFIGNTTGSSNHNETFGVAAVRFKGSVAKARKQFAKLLKSQAFKELPNSQACFATAADNDCNYEISSRQEIVQFTELPKYWMNKNVCVIKVYDFPDISQFS